MSVIAGACMSYWPDKFKLHPYWLALAFAVGFLMMIIPAAHSIYRWLCPGASPEEPLSPLEIIFEPLNPARRFWSLEAKRDFYGRVDGPYWEYRIEIKNGSDRTIRNVAVMVEHVGASPVKPRRADFVRLNAESCDLQPGCSELAAIVRWPHPKKRIGDLSGSSAWGYGPMKIVASADDAPPAERVFEFNPETEQMLFDEVP
jgi:hypothetical protein